MSTFLNDSLGVILLALSLLLVIFLKRANASASPPDWIRSEMPTLILITLAVGIFAIGLGVLLNASL